MSGSGSATLETQVLQHTLGIQSMAFPATLFFALCTTAPTSTTPGTPVAGGGYVRMPSTFAITANTSEAANAATIEWPAATAAWGTVGWLEIWDASTGGNRKFWGPLVDPVDLVTPIQRPIQTGDILRVPAGGVVIVCS